MDDSATTSAGARQIPGRQWVLAACLVVLAVVLVVGGLLSNDPPPRSAPAGSTPVTMPNTPAPAREPPPDGGLAVSPPVALTIAPIGVSSDLVRLGMERDRTVEVPENPDQAGWYQLGTSPGQPGSAVILGHVDSTTGPAVFHRLRELTPGALARVTLADGSVVTFQVTSVESIPNADFPAQKVYAGTPDRPTLAIVTCGGDYDADQDGYQSNVIAYAEHVGTSPAP